MLHLDWASPRYVAPQIESRAMEKGLGILVSEKLDLSHQCVLTDGRPTVSWPASHGVPWSPIQERCGAVGGGWRATRMITGLEHLSCGERLGS